VNKNRNRDTAWFSIIDGEWPALNDIRMLACAGKLDAKGKQKLCSRS
jgi:hypothetical protein